MDHEPHQEASTSSLQQYATSSSINANVVSDRALRSSSRTKGIKDKEDVAADQIFAHKQSRETKGKSKETPFSESSVVRTSKRSRRATLPPTASALIINESPKDPKGKKRAAPESASEDEEASSSSKRTKRQKMPKKSKTSAKGRASLKGKGLAVPSSSQFDADNDMMDIDSAAMALNDEDQMMHEGEERIDVAEKSNNEVDGGRPTPLIPAAEGHRTLEEPALSLFDFNRIGGYMSQLNGRLRTLLNNIKPEADPTTKVIALQELSELLSISTEDTLAGSFQVENFVRELVRIMGGTGGDAAREEGDGEEDEHDDEDAALAAALSMSNGGILPGDDNLEAQLLACRCLANLMEALPGCGHTLVYHGAIPVLCSKLLEISYIDLAEQTLITLEKISEEYPSAVVREGGLGALLNFLDFFSIAVQRTALKAAANCCRNASSDSFPMIQGVWPIIRNCLGYSDQRLVDYASLCIIRVIESYQRSQTGKLEALVDTDLIRAMNLLLLPSAGSSIVPPNTVMLLLRSLGSAARASPKITLALLEADIVTTIYQILTGVLPATSHEESDEQGNSESGQGLGGGIADMAVMQNLGHRPKDQVEETLSLVSELMPPLPKDGAFDHKGYSEKALARMVKARAKAERAAARALASQTLDMTGPSPSSSRAPTPVGGVSSNAEEEPGASAVMETNPDMAEVLPPLPAVVTPVKEPVVDRAELLRSNQAVVNRFIRLMAPTLVDVYAASVSIPSRIKCLAALLKAICFQEGEQLVASFKNVPIASFVSSILSSKDHPNLVIGGLQMVEVLLSKVFDDYQASFRREGVLHEIDILAIRPITPKQKEKQQPKELDTAGDLSDPSAPPAPTVSRKSHILDPEDAYTLRARVIQFKYLLDRTQTDGDGTFERLCHLVAVLKQDNAAEDLVNETLRDLGSLFASAHSSVSSFELLQSGLVDALLRFASFGSAADRTKRRRMLLQALAPCRMEKPISLTPPLAVLVKKLHECLTRMETLEVIMVTPGLEDTKRNSPSLLARQIRLRLVAEDGADTPRGCNNIVVSIHAIATFQALNDYLKPRLSGILSSLGGSRFSSMLAALAAGRFPPGALPPGALSALSGAPPPDSSTSPNLPAADEGKQERRRSQRLSAKASANSLAEKAHSAAAAAAPPSVASSSTAVATEPQGVKPTVQPQEVTEHDDLSSDDQDEFMDTEVDAEVFDEELDNEDGEAERTVSLSVADDGSKVEAQTPDGTRVATPAPVKDSSSAGPSSAAQPSRPSYAAALKSKTADWNLEFSMDDQTLPLDLTIYGAVHQHEARKTGNPTPPSNAMWQTVYTVKYKKATGPRPPTEVRQEAIEPPSRARSPLPTLASLSDDVPHSKILRLLRVLHTINSQIDDAGIPNAHPLPETSFINNKLTAKLTRQLEEPMIVASSCLPDWAMDLPLHFPFLFPFSTRFSFLQSTSFGYARLILKWQSHHSRSQENSRRDDTFGFLGRLQRQKVRISRKHLLESAFKVFELYGSSSSVLEVEYFDEVGTGLGPTLEFYSLVSKEFARRDLKIWRDADASYPGVYVHHPHGLFPAPAATGEESDKRINVYKVIGQFVAKAMLDSRIIDMSFNKIFLKYILAEDVPLTIANLRHVDPPLANSLSSIQDFSLSSTQNKVKNAYTTIDDLMLDFTLPGYDIELRPGGKDIAVTSENVQEYIHEVLDATIGKGVQKQARAFREGFSKVFPVNDLQAFSADELSLLFGSGEEDWSVETLSDAIRADHGYNIESQSIRDLLSIISTFENPLRRSFLQFCTGSPKLPIGGFRGLNPPLTVVRKVDEPPLSPDDYLPSVMTCVNYLKLPQYSSKATLRDKLLVAMKEGVGSFHLS